MPTLTKRLIAKAGETIPVPDLQPVEYAIEGLPEGQSAIVTEMKEGWIIVRRIDGEEQKSVRTYRTPDDALEALEKEVNG